MKPRVLIIIVLVLIMGFLWWRMPKPATTSPFKGTSTAAVSSSPVTPVPPSAATPPRGVPVPDAAERARLDVSAREQDESFRADFATPRDLYGLVVDDQDQPIEGASVYVDIADRLSSWKSSQHHLTSGRDGRFSLLGKPGANFYIKVSKAGYYAYSASQGSVFYAMPNDKHSHPPPTREQPTKFYLHKSNPAAQLIYHEHNQKVAKDGTPCEVSFTSGQQTAPGHGDFQVEAWTAESAVPGGRADWRCRISVPGGGLTERRGEISFEAPEAGYVPTFEYDSHSEEQNQVPGGARKQFFVKTREGKYARIQFEMIAGGDHFFSLWSYLNPTGARNLEDAPGKHGYGL